MLRTLASRGRTVLGSVVMRGRRVECPCCGSRFRRFQNFNGPDRVCWNCGSLERTRSLWLALDRHPELTRPGVRVLHVAPERILGERFRRVPDVKYVGGDLEAQFGPERIDVTRLQFEDASFDVVMCNHVLEHVPEDRRAMREIARVLKPGGQAILLVPDVSADVTDEDPAVVDPDERRRRFGQYDHVRRYGWDYVDRLEEAGLAVEVERPETALGDDLVARHRLRKYGAVEPIFVCRR